MSTSPQELLAQRQRDYAKAQDRRPLQSPDTGSSAGESAAATRPGSATAATRQARPAERSSAGCASAVTLHAPSPQAAS
jgi:hypothetical protein